MNMQCPTNLLKLRQSEEGKKKSPLSKGEKIITYQSQSNHEDA